MSRSSRYLIAALLAAALLAAACGGSDGGSTADTLAPGERIAGVIGKEDSAGAPRDGGTLTIGLNAETDGWDPAYNRWAGSGYIVGWSIMDPLAAYDDKLNPQPYLAKSFESTADFMQWTIHLREGVTFHDGDAVDADAVVQNFKNFESSFLTHEAYSFAETFTAVDPLTVVVRMRKPWSTFPHILTAQSGAIAAPSMLNGGEDANSKPVGSGPFVFDSWERNRTLRVHKNPTYWRKGYPHLDSIEFTPITDVSSRGQALNSGSIDLLETNSPTQIIEFRGQANAGNVQFLTDEQVDGTKTIVALNVTKEPFNDPIARQAIAYGADVVHLSEQAYQGVFPPAYGPFSPSSPFFADLGDLRPTYNPEKAKALAKEYEAKHGKPLEFSALILPEPEIRQVAQVLQAQEREAGIIVHLEEMEQLKLILRALGGDYQATGFYLFGSPHPDRDYVFSSSAPKPNGETSLNFTRQGLNSDGTPNTANDRLVNAMNEARKTLDVEKQKAQYRIMQEEIAKNLNFLFLVRQTNAVVYDNRVHGAVKYSLPNADGSDGPTGLLTTQTMTFNLWVDP